MNFVDQRFENTTVDLDGNAFQNCSFENVCFRYDGGDFSFNGCTLGGGILWSYGGDLGRGLTNLAAVYGLPVNNLLNAISSALDERVHPQMH